MERCTAVVTNKLAPKRYVTITGCKIPTPYSPAPASYSLLSVFFFAPTTFFGTSFSAAAPPPSTPRLLTVLFFGETRASASVAGDAEDVLEKVEGWRGRVGKGTAEGTCFAGDGAEVEAMGANSEGAPLRGVAWIEVQRRAREA